MITSPHNSSTSQTPATPGRSAVAAPSAGVSPAPSFDLWRTAHRALRGNYRTVCVVGAIGAIAGAGVGLMFGKRLYTATGLVRIASVLPTVLKETDQNRPMAMFDGFIQAQRDLILGRDMILAASSDESWRRSGDRVRPPSEEDFAAGLKVETRPRSDFLKVSFTGPEPDTAAASVRAIVSAYQKSFTREQERSESQRTGQLKSRRESLLAESQSLQTEMDAIADGRTAAELEPLCASAADRVKRLRNALAEVQVALAGGPEVVQRQTPSGRTPGDAVTDEILRSYTVEMVRIENLLAEARSRGCGSAHPSIQRLERLADEYRARVASFTSATETSRSARASAAAPMSLAARQTSLQMFTKAAEDDLKRLTSERSQLTLLEDRAAALNKNLSDTDARLDALATEASLGNRLTVVSSGEKPITAAIDNRAKTATVGALTGMGLPIAAMVLVTSLRRRYRFSDEVAEDLAYRVPFIGVLPDLIEDKQFGPVAAHGIHDLRVRLQPASAEHPRTYLVTSASDGEGKSSLSLALGLSFAAAGFRTLLIDADTGSRRLSFSFDTSDCPGLSEAMAGDRPFIRAVRSGLAVLSAGRNRPQDACRFSPVAAASLLTDLLGQFDVILIDGDPVLTGARSSVIAPLVDGVILTLSRGQEQKVLLDAARQVEMLGANLGGVVFNRASVADFPEIVVRQSQLLSTENRHLSRRLERFGLLVGATLSSLSLVEAEELDLAPFDAGQPAKGTSHRAAA